MTRLRDVRPEDFLRAGAVLGQAAEELGSTVAACRRSAEVRWVGRPNQQYQRQLGGLVRDLGRVQRAFDEACDALLVYSRAMTPVAELALEADLLEARADDLRPGRDLTSGMGLLYGAPTAEERVLRDRAALLQAEASQQELLASGRLVGVLRALADDAPHLSGWVSADRSAAAFARGAHDQVAGTAAVAGDALLSLPIVGDARSRAQARRRLWAAAKGVAQPWLAVEDLLRQLGEGHVAYAGGSLGAALVLRVRGARGAAVEKFGAHDAMPLDVLWGLKRGGFGGADLASVRVWVERRAQQELLEALLLLEKVPLPSLDELIANGVDLLHQEAHGGHTLLRHVARDVDFLRHRQATEPGRSGPMPKSSFLDLDEAERAVSNALVLAADELRSWDLKQPVVELRVPLTEPAGMMIDQRGKMAPAGAVVVRLARGRNGEVMVSTAFLDAGSDG